jgi:hypothetical protein
MQLPTRVAFRALSVIAILVFLFSSVLFSQGIVIKEKVEIHPQVSSKIHLQSVGTRSSVTFVTPYAGKVYYEIASFDSVQNDDAKLIMNGTTIFEDLIEELQNPPIDGYLGEYGGGSTLTFSMMHNGGDSTWLAQISDTFIGQCFSSCVIVFSLVPIYGTPYETGDWGSWPTYIGMHIYCSNEVEQAKRYFMPTWDQGKYVFGEPITLGIYETGPCNTIFYPVPEGTPCNFTITEGQEKTILHDIFSGNEGASLSEIPACNGSGSVQLKVIGDEPPQPIYVTVQGGFNGSNVCSGRLELRPGDLKIIPTKTTIEYGDTLRFDVWKRMEDGSLGPLPSGTSLIYYIFEGNDAGYLYSPDSSQYCDFIDGDFTSAMFAALEELPQSNSTEVKVLVKAFEPGGGGGGGGGLPCSVKIIPESQKTLKKIVSSKIQGIISKQTSVRKNTDSSYSYGNRNQSKLLNTSDASIQGTDSDGSLVGVLTIHVVKPCIFASFAKSPLSIGDTTELSFKYYTETGVPVPADKLLDVTILSGEGSGWLLSSSGETNLTLNNAVQPIRYIAPRSIQGDSLLVYIKAVVSEPDVANGLDGMAASVSLKDTSTVKVTKLANSTEKIESAVKRLKGPKGETIQPQSLSLAMIKALNEPVCVEGPAGEVDGPKLVILDLPNDQKIQKIEGTNPPRMPKPPIKVQLKNFNKGDVKFEWDMIIKWNGRGNFKTPREKEIYTGITKTTNDNIVDINLDLNAYVRGGQKVILNVKADADGNSYHAKKEDLFELKGLNPDDGVIRNEITAVAPTTVWNYETHDEKMLHIITYKESKFNQFAPNASIKNRKDPFYPLQGSDPRDFGLMQVSKPASDDLIWNWKKNITGGISKFNEKKRSVADYIYAIKEGRCWGTQWVPQPDGSRKKEWKAAQPVRQTWYSNLTKKPKDPIYNPTSLTEDQRITEIFQRYNGWAYYRWVPTDPKNQAGSGVWKEEPIKVDNKGVAGGYAKDCMNYYNGTLPW